MITCTVDDAKLQATLSAMPAKLRTMLAASIFSLSAKLRTHIVQDKLQGQVLNKRSGALQRSIQFAVTQGPDSVVGKVYSSGDVKYAGIHEYGGRIPAHIITPKNGDALSFIMNGKRIFAKSVQHPGAIMPERSFMRSGLNDMRQEILTTISKTVTEAMKV